MSNKEKRELAELMYIKGAVDTQAELAERFDVSEVTISTWKTKYKWDDKKKSLLTTRQEELRNLYDQLAELNAAIKQREPGKRYADNREADIQRKITASIRELETDLSVAASVDVLTKFSDWLQIQDFDKAKEFVGYMDGFLKSLYSK